MSAAAQGREVEAPGRRGRGSGLVEDGGGGEFVIVGEELEARTYKRMRAVGVSPLAEVHSGQNPGVAGDTWVSGRSGRGMAGQGSSERGLGGGRKSIGMS